MRVWKKEKKIKYEILEYFCQTISEILDTVSKSVSENRKKFVNFIVL